MTIRVSGKTVIDGNRNVIVGSFAANPTSPSSGTLIFDSNNRVLKGWDGTQWVNLTQGGNGGAWAWGDNGLGQLGNNTTTNRSSPVSVVGGFTDWVQISAGISHIAAIRANGTAWAWGSNFEVQLGDNTIATRSSPVSVVGGFTDWVQISAGGYHNVALRTNGTTWAWGKNNKGQLGDNTTTNRSSPVAVVGGFTDWVQISAGDSHTAAIRANGTAWGWGDNTSGQIGNNTTSSRSSPVSVVGGFTDWVQISAGGAHTAAIRANGTAWTWGSNYTGRLGDNTTSDRSSPVSVVGGFTDWVQISAGFQHTAAVRANGTAWTWGKNSISYYVYGSGTTILIDGRLGTNSSISSSLSPVSVVGGFTDWVQLSAGRYHTAAVRANGTAWAWGYNAITGPYGTTIFGQLGNNSSLPSSSPVSVVGGFTDWVQVSARNFQTAAIRFT